MNRERLENGQRMARGSPKMARELPENGQRMDKE